MKRSISGLLSGLLLIFIFGLISVHSLNAQVPPPPPNGGPNSGHGMGGNQPAGASAPIGSGTLILLVLGSAYAGNKMYKNREE